MGKGGGSGSDSSSELPSKKVMIILTIGIHSDILLFILGIAFSYNNT